MPEILCFSVHRHQAYRLGVCAGDGDVALELAAVWVEDDTARQRLIGDYARIAHLDAGQLGASGQGWRPWVVMLMAGLV